MVQRLEGVDLAALAELGDLHNVEVRTADKPDLSLTDERVQCRRRLVDRGCGVGPVNLIEIDVVRAECFEARLDAGSKPSWTRVADQAIALHAQTALRGDDDLVAAVA